MSYPEIEATAATPQVLHALFRSDGSLLIRAFFSPEEVETLKRIGNLSYAIGEAIAANAPPEQLPREIADGLLTRGYISWIRMKAWLGCSGTNLDARLAAIVDKVSAVAKAVYADPTARLLEGFSVIRRHRRSPRVGEFTTVPWHRDFSFVGPAGIDRSVNFWIPLAEVGETAPSIEVIVGSHGYMVKVPDETPGITNIEEQWVADHLCGYLKWTPRCKPGDVMVFDHQTVHRTQPLAVQASMDRINFEMRWTPQA
jgi:Phytanoyl-CoA dioxygenase (PhyH)